MVLATFESRHSVRRCAGAGQIFGQNSYIEGRQMMTMNRRSFSAAMVVGAAASLNLHRGTAANPASTKARNRRP